MRLRILKHRIDVTAKDISDGAARSGGSLVSYRDSLIRKLPEDRLQFLSTETQMWTDVRAEERYLTIDELDKL